LFITSGYGLICIGKGNKGKGIKKEYDRVLNSDFITEKLYWVFIIRGMQIVDTIYNLLARLLVDSLQA